MMLLNGVVLLMMDIHLFFCGVSLSMDVVGVRCRVFVAGYEWTNTLILQNHPNLTSS